MNKQDKLIKFMHSWQKEQDPKSNTLVVGKGLLEFLDKNSPIKLDIGSGKTTSHLMNGRTLWLKFVKDGLGFYQIADGIGGSENSVEMRPKYWSTNGNKNGLTPISNQIAYSEYIATQIYAIIKNVPYQEINTKKLFKNISKLQKTNEFIKKNKAEMVKTSKSTLMTKKMDKCFQYMIDGEHDISTITLDCYGLDDIFLESMKKTASDNKAINFKTVTPVATYNLLNNTIDNLAVKSK